MACRDGPLTVSLDRIKLLLDRINKINRIFATGIAAAIKALNAINGIKALKSGGINLKQNFTIS